MSDVEPILPTDSPAEVLRKSKAAGARTRGRTPVAPGIEPLNDAEEAEVAALVAGNTPDAPAPALTEAQEAARAASQARLDEVLGRARAKLNEPEAPAEEPVPVDFPIEIIDEQPEGAEPVAPAPPPSASDALDEEEDFPAPPGDIENDGDVEPMVVDGKEHREPMPWDEPANDPPAEPDGWHDTPEETLADMESIRALGGDPRQANPPEGHPGHVRLDANGEPYQSGLVTHPAKPRAKTLYVVLRQRLVSPGPDLDNVYAWVPVAAGVEGYNREAVGRAVFEAAVEQAYRVGDTDEITALHESLWLSLPMSAYVPYRGEAEVKLTTTFLSAPAEAE